MDGWAIRLIAAALLTLSGAAGGRALAGARRARAEQLRDIVGALDRLKVGMLEKYLPLAEALARAGHPALLRVGGVVRGARPVADAWISVRPELTARGACLGFLDAQELAVLGALFEAIGASGASEQRLLLNDAQEQLAHLAETAARKADEQARLYTSLGLLAGLAASICLL